MNHQFAIASVAQRLLSSLEAMTAYARSVGDPSLPSLQSLFKQAELTMSIAKLQLSPCALEQAITAQTPVDVSNSVILALHAAREAKSGSL